MINPVETQKERILLVESDPQINELIAQQTLRPLGYQVEVVESASSAINDIDKIAPDLIIADLCLPEVSGKDLLVALTSQGIDVPVIVITPRGRESDALQAFRLGAVDFLTHPIREFEVVNVVEDTLYQRRKRDELHSYSRQLDQNKEELEKRIRDLTEIFSIGKLTPSIANQQLLYERIIHVALLITQADAAWMLTLDIKRKKYILQACLNADEAIQSKLNLPYEDGLSSLVAVSGQFISLHGDALRPFELSELVEAALIVPIKQKEEVSGMLVVVRKTPQPFSKDQHAMLEMVAEYSSILLENSRHYQKLEVRLSYLQQSGIYATIDSDLKNDLLRQAGMELRNPIKSLMDNLDVLSNQAERRFNLKQSDAIIAIEEEADILMDIADSMVRIQQGDTSKSLEDIDLNQVVREVVNRSQAIAQVSGIAIRLEIPPQPSIVTVFASQITKVIEGLVSNALKYNSPKAQIMIRIEKKDDCTMLMIKDQGNGVDESLIERLFDKKSGLLGEEARRFGGIGISLPMMKEIIAAHGGEIWVESGYGKGFTVFFTLPRKLTHSD
ncbi:MAG: hypothetical protein A2Y88_05900 [Chloroflexi bacterium RBG_13_48_10]|nr:MAG: hypothetical protein A2Y88_05900 [Chloroflexi bacterium RBG_13_48_10]